MPKRGDAQCPRLPPWWLPAPRIKPRTKGRAVRGPASTSEARRFYLPAAKTVNTDSSVIRASISQYTSYSKIVARYFAKHFARHFEVSRK